MVEKSEKTSKKVKIDLVLNEMRNFGKKTCKAGDVVLSGELLIPEVTINDLNRGFAIKQITAQEA